MTETTKEKHVLIFSAEWCSPCKQMKAKVLPDVHVKKRLSEYSSVQYLNVDDPKGRHFSMLYKVDTIPTILIVDEKGQPFKRGSFMSTPMFLEFLE